MNETESMKTLLDKFYPYGKMKIDCSVPLWDSLLCATAGVS